MDSKESTTETVKSIKDAVSARIDPAAAKGEQMYESAREDIAQSLEKLKREINDLDVDEIRTKVLAWVKANPILAVAAAAGVGLIIGRILRSAQSGDEPPGPTTRQVRSGAPRKEAGFIQTVGDAVKSIVANEAINRVTKLVQGDTPNQQDKL